MIMLYWSEKNLMKLHIFAAEHKVNTYRGKLFPLDDCAPILSWPPVKLWRHMKPKNMASSKNKMSAQKLQGFFEQEKV